MEVKMAFTSEAFQRFMEDAGFTSLVIVGFRDGDGGSVVVEADATEEQCHTAAGYILRTLIQAHVPTGRADA